ncbi:autophagy associated protein Atg14 [Schizosaccharomyces osmophilus]|uniref:Autophagy-related protein 14 n=1 Tax=Schizosaccharomyces osmophilus TaxID=2545709 RepID=A0AAE9WCN0_9SCHI|nr:autophagy associated protein Atg14 [Schizosaccharomyces osmophilus]WBW73710.1 autophagy associated protein Atg14 [Schizosaccharomyces osmophilus]
MPNATKCQLCETRRPSICEQCLCRDLTSFFKFKDQNQKEVFSHVEHIRQHQGKHVLFRKCVSEKEVLLHKLERLCHIRNDKLSVLSTLQEKIHTMKQETQGRRESLELKSKNLNDCSIHNRDLCAERYIYSLQHSETLQVKLAELQQSLIRKVLDMYQLHWRRDVRLLSMDNGRKHFSENEGGTDSIDASLAYQLSKLTMSVSGSGSGYEENVQRRNQAFLEQATQLNDSVTISGVDVCTKNKEKVFLNPESALTLSFICIFLAQYLNVTLPCPIQLPSPDQKALPVYSNDQMLYIMYNIGWLASITGTFIIPKGMSQLQQMELLQCTGFWLVQLQSKSIQVKSLACCPQLEMDFVTFYRLSCAHNPYAFSYGQTRSKSSKAFQLIS